MAFNDEMSDVPKGIDYAHAQIHAGNTYRVGHSNSALADNGTIVFHITNGATKKMHMIWNASCGGDAVVNLYETPVSATSGTAVTPLNKNRASTNVSLATVLRDPTIGTAGTLIDTVALGAGAGGNSGGGEAGDRNEWILPVAGVYAVELLNLGGGAKLAGLNVEWYEAADKS